MSNEANNSPSFSQLVREVPDYQTATGEVRAAMDQILEGASVYDLDAIRLFGDEAQDERKQVSEEILGAQEGDGFEALSAPLEEAAGLMGQFDLEGIGQSLALMSAKGVKVLYRNKGMAATAAVATALLGPLALLGGGAAIYAKETGQKLYNKAKPETLEEMESRLRDGIAAFKPMVAGVEEAQKSIPSVRRNIQNLGNANMAALVRLTMFIGAGRELERRIVEEEMPANRADAETTDLLTQSRAILSVKVANLEQSRNGSIRDITILGNLMSALEDNDLAIQSIMTHEMPNHRASLAAQKQTADVLRFTRVIDEFRAKTQGDIKNTIKATDRARQLAAANRSDSPEQLQAALDQMNQVKELLGKAIKALPAAEKQKEKLRGQLTAATTNVVDAQVAFAQAKTANTSRQLAPATQAKALPAPAQGSRR